jgi:F-type H+-transporting ATPase subunit delta
MPSTSHHSPIALSYARALLELAREQHTHELIAQDLAALRKAIDADPNFRQFLRDPGISKDERRGVFDRALKPHFHPLVTSFLGVVNQHGRSGLLDEIAAAYQALLDQLQGKVEVEVTVAKKLTKEQLEQVRRRLGEALKRTAIVNQRVDDSIIGGLVLKVEDKLIDASVRSQLQAMKKQMLSKRPR